MTNYNMIPEVQLQKAVQQILSDPAAVKQTVQGRNMQVLSPGRFNVHEGPDFKEVALLMDGQIYIGDAEFHRQSSEWVTHGHNTDPNYEAVILHIVVKDNAGEKEYPFHTLLIDENDLLEAYENLQKQSKKEVDISSVEDLQDYALLRLLRKSTEAQKKFNEFGLEKAAQQTAYDFIQSYNSKRRRPVYTSEELEELLKNFNDSEAFHFLDALYAGEKMFIPDRMHKLLKTKFLDEGSHLRREIILNCILPIAICLAETDSRIGLFLWYWSTPALNSYGILKRKFPNMPQNFLWQQQGMLEYLKEYGRKPGMVSESVKNIYGFAETLHFLKIGKSALEPM